MEMGSTGVKLKADERSEAHRFWRGASKFRNEQRRREECGFSGESSERGLR